MSEPGDSTAQFTETNARPTDARSTNARPADDSATDSAAIEVNGVTKRFGDAVAVDDASFTIRRGEIAAFLGPNGSGKTTFVRLLNGVLSPTSGEISVLGYDVNETPLPVQRRSGVVTESLSLYERFSGRYNLSFYARLYGVGDGDASNRIEDLSELLDLQSYLDDPVETYSTGMKKRLLLARALLHDPDVLFLDEPTNGLDPQAARTVVEHIDAIRREQDVTVFLCTHDLQVAEQLATRIFFLDHGEIVTTGTPAELRSELWPEVAVEATLGGWSDSLATDLADTPWVLDVETGTDRSDVPDTTVARVELADREAIPKLVDRLVDRGVRLYRLDEDSHSLEEMYFRVREEVR